MSLVSDTTKSLMKYGDNPAAILSAMRSLFSGRIPLSEEDAAVLAEYGGKPAGHYIEIGVGFGGSLCLAAFYKAMYHSGMYLCHGIDPMNGYYGEGRADSKSGVVPSLEVLTSNMRMLGIGDHQYHVYPQKHPPWPGVLERATYTSGFIDGDHKGKAPMMDWKSMKNHVTDFVIFHDINKPHVRKAFRAAYEDDEWGMELSRSTIGVVRRMK